MSLFSRLFGGGGKPEPEPEAHQGFSIMATPIREGSKFRISARIEKEIDGEKKEHVLIRADTVDDIETATQVSLAKARMLIDTQGESLFD